MEYQKLISVTGLGGLFELVASKTDGAIVRSLDDKSVKFVSSRQHNFSHIESIEVYTVRDNVNLVDVFHAMTESNEPLPSEKDAAAIKKYFQKVYPDMDFERVYTSDMKKMVRWFSILNKHGIEIKLSDNTSENEEGTEIADEPAETTEVKEEKPEKKSAAKKESKEEILAAEEAPKKKAAKKKSAE